jgi:hypothetical protein
VNKSFMKLVEEEISQSLLHFYFVSVKNGNEAEDEDGEWYWRRSGPKLFEICIRFFMKYMTLGSKTILDTLYQFFCRLQLYCMTVLVYGCGNQFSMHCQMNFMFCYGCGIQISYSRC